MLIRLKNYLKGRLQSPKKWKDIEYFDERWKARMSSMAKYIPGNSSVMDLGCGPMWLKEFISTELYFPVDYKRRDENTIVCDFNKHEFPDIKCDYVFVGGCLEYVVDFDWFISSISNRANNCVISYCCTGQFPDINHRRSLTWVNDLSRVELIKLFDQSGMKLVNEEMASQNSIFVFKKFR